MNTTHNARRQFLRRASQFGALAGSPFALNLLSIGSAAAQSASDHKALVCIFLFGGNDQSNTLLPASGAAYTAYRNARPELALTAAQMVGISPQGYNGTPLALHGALAPLVPLFNARKLAILPNVGTLCVPTTKAQYNRGDPSVPLPHQLFSHSDQQGAWQTGLPDRASSTGWFGRIGDLTQSAFNPGSGVSICMSIGGNTSLLAGDSTLQYQLNSSGAVKVAGLDGLYGQAAGGTALRRLLSEPRGHLLEGELVKISARALAAQGLVNSALAGVNVATPFPATGLGQQLRMVARMIAARGALAQRRQLFFVQAGGYDFHDNLLNEQGARLREVGEAMAAFQTAIDTMGVAPQVTAFTASEFGRGLQSNGRGSDHGWGGHQFVMGGAVQGGRLFGAMPTVALGGPEDAGQGRLIPTTSVDEFGATLARWFGVSDSNLPLVLPNIGRFAQRDMGFLL